MTSACGSRASRADVSERADPDGGSTRSALTFRREVRAIPRLVPLFAPAFSVLPLNPSERVFVSVRSNIRRSLNVTALTLGLAVLGASAASAQETHTVDPGDTLFEIAADVDGTSWRELAEYNADIIANPDLIYVGQVLSLTDDGAIGTDVEADAEVEPEAVEPQSTPVEESTPVAFEESASGGSVATSTWDALAQCESTGDWSINTGNGYYGGLQFTISSWNAVGGDGMPHEASKEEQIARAEQLLELQGWGAWPECSSKLGLR